MKYDMIIFDCNGVILDDERMIKQVIVDELSSRGRRVSMDYALRNLVGVPEPIANQRIFDACGYMPNKLFWENSRARVRANFDKAAQETTKKSSNPFVMPDVTSLIHALGDAKKCIVSNNTEQMLHYCLCRTDLWKHFQGTVFHAGHVKNGKPSPDLFWHAARQMEVLPSRCLVIEDGVVGVQGAIAAGMSVWGFAGGSHCSYDRKAYGKALRDAGAGKVYCTMHDVEKALGLRGSFGTPSAPSAGSEVLSL